MSSASAEVLKTAIGTHSGSFHCDEALACGMLKMLPEWKDATIVNILQSITQVLNILQTYDVLKRTLLGILTVDYLKNR